MSDLNIFIITGLSGSGKSTAIAAFQDAGYFCVDNLPIVLLPKFLELSSDSISDRVGLAMVMDLREKEFLNKYSAILKDLEKQDYNFKILFLESDEKTILRRYSQTRRRHPSSDGADILQGIHSEIEKLAGLREKANKIIDTSNYNVHDLKAVVLEIATAKTEKVPIRINIISFGFKYGQPIQADLMIDVRFLANPYFIPELKQLNGNDQKIKDFVLNNDETRTFLKKYIDLLDYLLPLYEKEGKAYLTIFIGCTGGRHRSVVIANEIHNQLKKTWKKIEIRHRDINM